MPSDLVPSAGRTPNSVLLCGEAPGEQEWKAGQPFVGRSGIEQEWYLRRHGCSAQSMYRTNVVKRYIEGNPDPTPELIAEFSPQLERELSEVAPSVVLAVGRFAARWFLGDSADMEAVHGLSCPAGAFDPSRAHRGGPGNAVIIPIYHPAFGLYDPDMKGLIDYDYSVAADYAKRSRLGFMGRRDDFYDPYEGQESYRIVDGRELEAHLDARLPDALIGLDTETHGDEEIADRPWSIQVSTAPGTGLLLRADDRYFNRGIRAIQRVANNPANTIGIHNALFDIEMCRSMGLELRDARIFDTRYAAYLLRLEPQKLKLLAYRRARMHMRSYQSVVHSAARDRHIEYLWRVLEAKPWPKPAPVLEFKNDGSWKPRNPMKIERRVESILADAQEDRGLDIYSRWMDVDEPLRRTVEERLGERMTPAYLGDADPEVATRYACRDADAVVRLVPTLRRMLKEQNVATLMRDGMHILGICEEMQSEGMQADRAHFTRLLEDTGNSMEKIQRTLSRDFYAGLPFNPASPDHVRNIMLRRGLEGEEMTKTGKISTSKKSIQHLRHLDRALGLIFDFRESQKVQTAFCIPILEKGAITPEAARFRVRPQLLTTKVHTRRLASKDPNFLAMPVRSDLGKRLRDGFFPPEDHAFGGWDLCLAPDTRVLTAQLKWVPISTVIEGAKLVAIDETNRPARPRRLRTAVVEKVGRRVSECVEIELSNGKRIIASCEHPWLTRRKHRKNSSWAWTCTSALEIGDEFCKFLDPWEEDRTRDGGWLAGMFDGEGSFDRADATITFTQRAGNVMKMVRKLLADRGYDFHQPGSKEGGFPGSRPAQHIWMCGMVDCVRLVGTLRPIRFLKNIAEVWEGKELRHHRLSKTSPNDRTAVTVVGLARVGERAVISMQTSTRTFVAEGFFTHNSQIEMRRAADLSADPILCALFSEGRCDTCAAIYKTRRSGPCDKPSCSGTVKDRDVHTETAATIFGLAMKDVDKLKHRAPAKNCAFGILYGISGPALYAQFRMMGTAAGWTEQKCSKLIEDWLDIYSGVRRYIAKCAEDTRRAGGVVRDEWGMMRHIPGIFHYDRGVRSAAERIAMSHRVQGGAQGMIQNSMRWIDQRVREIRAEGVDVGWVLQIHDEIILHFDEEMWPRLDKIVREGLTKYHGVVGMKVPVDASGNMGRHWGELK